MSEELIRSHWEEIKQHVREEYGLSDVSYKTWIENLQVYRVENHVVTIMIPSDQKYSLTYIDSKYRNYFRITITEMMQDDYDVEFILENNASFQDSSAPANRVSSYNINYENSTNCLFSNKISTKFYPKNNRNPQRKPF